MAWVTCITRNLYRITLTGCHMVLNKYFNYDNSPVNCLKRLSETWNESSVFICMAGMLCSLFHPSLWDVVLVWRDRGSHRAANSVTLDYFWCYSLANSTYILLFKYSIFVKHHISAMEGYPICAWLKLVKLCDRKNLLPNFTLILVNKTWLVVNLWMNQVSRVRTAVSVIGIKNCICPTI